MDFGLGLVVGQNPSEHEHEHQLVLEGKPRSGSIKQDRSDPYDYEDGGIRVSKMAKRADDLGQLRSNIDNVTCLPKEQMLSFSSNKPEVSFLSAKDLGDKNAQNLAFSYYHTPTGFGSGGNLNGEMHGAFTGIRGPFTPAQWIELEHQAMIFKYFIANIPVPANLLVPIRKAISSSGFPGFSVGSYPSHSYGWGSFHLGFSGSTDPEPGRCRRTDGKKWRCSRDAVPDQKYCERHINRGRHRSRKPVEGLNGQAASGPTTTATKGTPAISAAMSSLVTSSSGGASSNTVTIAHHQIKGFQSSGGAIASTDTIVNSRFKDQQEPTVMPSTMNFKSKDDPPFSILKQNIPLDESSQLEFGLVSTDSLLNPSQKGSYFNCKIYDSSLLELNAEQTQDPLRHFTAEWPNDHQSNPSTLPWTEELKSDWTQLSMSIPISRVGPKQNSRIPTPWVNTMGGPLGEVLLKNASPKVGSSPTGVLQESTFVSRSNTSSGGSSPKEGASCKC